MAEKLKTIFVHRVKAVLAEYEWSQGDLAREMDVSSGYISQLLSGHRKAGLDTLEKVAAALQIDPSELISEKVAT